MGIVKGGALRLLQTLLYAICFCCAAIILGIYSYFLSVQADRNVPIPTKQKAVEGLSGVAVLYTIFAVILTCCLGGISFFAFLALVLDILFVGAMIAIAVLTRHGANSCTGFVRTPLGNGPANTQGGYGNDNLTYSVSLYHACQLNTACFAVAIIAAVFFLITAAMQIALVRSHKKEKRYGPSPKNNYTSGYGSRFFKRGNKKPYTRDAEMATAGTTAGTGLAVPANDMRPSHETGYTGSTVGGTGVTGGATPYDKVDGYQNGTGYNSAHSGYHTQPTGTGVNPYGYGDGNTIATNTHVRPAGAATNY